MNAGEYLSKQKVNVELILWTNDKGILHHCIRLRPWKQTGLVPVMVIALGMDIEDALRNAARMHFQEKWEKLDYAARPWNTAPEYIDPLTNAVQLDFLDAVPSSTRVIHEVLNDHTGTNLKMRQIKP